MNTETNYIDHYVFPKQGGGGGGVSLSDLINPAILTTSLLVGGSGSGSGSRSKSINPTLGTELFVPGGLVFIPENSFQETREYVSMDPFHVPVMDLFDDLLDLVEVRESGSGSGSGSGETNSQKEKSSQPKGSREKRKESTKQRRTKKKIRVRIH